VPAPWASRPIAGSAFGSDHCREDRIITCNGGLLVSPGHFGHSPALDILVVPVATSSLTGEPACGWSGLRKIKTDPADHQCLHWGLPAGERGCSTSAGPPRTADGAAMADSIRLSEMIAETRMSMRDISSRAGVSAALT